MLRWRLLGIKFTIEPSFWFMNALWALLMAGPLSGQRAQDRVLFVFILAWIFCALVSTMVHELGHAVTGRIFGAPGNIVLSGSGGSAVGAYGELRVWQRLLVIAAGPAAGFTLAFLVIAFDGRGWNGLMDYFAVVTNGPTCLDYKLRLNWVQHTPLAEWARDGNLPYLITINILTFVNLFTNIINLFPIIPMDGGMIMKELLCLVFPREGLKVAFGISFVLALAAALFYLELTLERYQVLERRIEKYYPFGFPEFSLIIFLSLAYQSFVVYRQLMAMERHSLYMQRDD